MVGRFEVLLRVVGSGLPYIQVVDSWDTRDGAVALAWRRAIEEYPGYQVELVGERVVVREWEDGEVLAQFWVWENEEVE